MTTEFKHALITASRLEFHQKLIKQVLTISSEGIASNADRSSSLSRQLALRVAQQLVSETGVKIAGQTSGNEFEELVAQFTNDTFNKLGSIRPGKFHVLRVGARAGLKTADYEQYSHLKALKLAADSNPDLSIALGREYTIAPDVVIYQELLSDEEINATAAIVDTQTARLASLRQLNGGLPLLHASISTKWTMRSDRAQNSRSEALNLIRNRKGHLPHVVVVTAEPLPSRLSSLALGTGDIDCVYHFALYELQRAVVESGNEEAISLLSIMVEGKRLKDISDLPLDLTL